MANHQESSDFDVNIGCYSLRLGVILDEFDDFRYHAVQGRYGPNATFTPKIVDENKDGIRLGFDFIDNVSDYLFVGEESDIIPSHIKKMLAKQLESVLTCVEVYVQRIAINRVKMHLLEHSSENHRCSYSLHCEGEDIKLNFVMEFREVVTQAYKIGKVVGFEIGQKVLKAMYGSQPANTRVYTYSQDRHFKGSQYKGTKNGVLVCQQIRILPIRAYSIDERQEIYTRKKRELDRMLYACELKIIDLIVCRIKFLLDKHGKEHPIRMYEGNDIQLQINELADTCISTGLELGKFDGFDCGQHALKVMYGYYPEDQKIYSFVGPAEPYRITLDLGDSTRVCKCTCGTCFHCVHSETKEKCKLHLKNLSQTKAEVQKFILAYHNTFGDTK